MNKVKFFYQMEEVYDICYIYLFVHVYKIHKVKQCAYIILYEFT